MSAIKIQQKQQEEQQQQQKKQLQQFIVNLKRESTKEKQILWKCSPADDVERIIKRYVCAWVSVVVYVSACECVCVLCTTTGQNCVQ